MTMAYFADIHGKVVTFSRDVYDIWVSTENPKAQYFTPIADPPEGGVWNGSEWIVLTPAATVPAMVTNLQARLALLNAGLLGAVEDAVKTSANAELKMAWEYAQNFYRQSPALMQLATALQLTPQQLDELFTAASQIEV